MTLVVLVSGGGIVTRSNTKQPAGVDPTLATYMGCPLGLLVHVKKVKFPYTASWIMIVMPLKEKPEKIAVVGGFSA